jgi:hypothetical protein
MSVVNPVINEVCRRFHLSFIYHTISAGIHFLGVVNATKAIYQTSVISTSLAAIPSPVDLLLDASSE